MNGTVQTKPLTDAEKKDFFAALIQQLPVQELFERPSYIRSLLAHKQTIGMKYRVGFLDQPMGVTMDTDSQKNRWQQRFNEDGIACAVAKVKIPKRQEGFNRLIIVPQGLMLNEQVKILREKFGMWLNVDDLDKVIEHNDRSNEDGAYAIWVRDNVEADKENKNLSANDISTKKIVGQTLLERLLHEWAYFDETNKHLDIKNITLCTGSRYFDGRVPDVYWFSVDRKVSVAWSHAAHSGGDLRTRAVVS